MVGSMINLFLSLTQLVYYYCQECLIVRYIIENNSAVFYTIVGIASYSLTKYLHSQHLLFQLTESRLHRVCHSALLLIRFTLSFPRIQVYIIYSIQLVEIISYWEDVVLFTNIIRQLFPSKQREDKYLTLNILNKWVINFYSLKGSSTQFFQRNCFD